MPRNIIQNVSFLAMETKAVESLAEGYSKKVNMSCQTIIQGQNTGKLYRLLVIGLENINFKITSTKFITIIDLL